MFGPIMAAPLAMPVIWTVRPPSVNVRPASLCVVSVVSMPRAAATSGASSWPTACRRPRMPAAIFSIGRNSPMMPVDSTSACSGFAPAGLGRQLGHLAGVAMPRSPVQALALPELITTARIAAARRARAIERHRRGEDEVLRIDAGGHGRRDRKRSATDPASRRCASRRNTRRPAENLAERDGMEMRSWTVGFEDAREMSRKSARVGGAFDRRWFRSSAYKAVVSGKPYIRLKFCTAAPAAPLIRLSRTTDRDHPARAPRGP